LAPVAFSRDGDSGQFVELHIGLPERELKAILGHDQQNGSETISDRGSPGAGTAARVVRENPPAGPTERTASAWIAIGLAAVIAASPIANGYFNFNVWGPLALIALAVVVASVRGLRPTFTGQGLVSLSGLVALVGLSAASMLWAESKEAAWTATNRATLYAAVFAIALLTVRDRWSGRAVILLIGVGALVACILLDCAFLAGHGQSAFITDRLDSPIGYINGTAALLAMGTWPWVAAAESAHRRVWRGMALSAATLTLGTAVLTQSRALVPAMLVSAALVLLCAGGRIQRALNLLILLIAVGISMRWTLAVYSHGASTQHTLPPSPTVLRGAAVALFVCAAVAGATQYGVAGALARLPHIRRQTLERRVGRALLVGLATFALVGALLGAPLIARQWRQFTSQARDKNTTNRFVEAGGFRYDLWRIALQEFREHPIAGLGAGNYDSEYYALRRNPEYVLQPHSLELQMLAELGAVGFASLVLFCAPILVAGFRRNGTLASEDRLIKVGAYGLFTAWLIDTTVDWPYDIAGIACMAMVAGALLLVPTRNSGTIRAPRQGFRWVLPVILVIALLGASVGRQYAAARLSSAGAAEIARAPADAIRTLRLGAQLDPYSLSTLYALAAAYARLDEYSAAREVLVVAGRREPLNYVPPALMGDLAMRRGAYSMAVNDYEQAIALNPRDPGLRSALAAALTAKTR
jgi:hypothetical protein